MAESLDPQTGRPAGGLPPAPPSPGTIVTDPLLLRQLEAAPNDAMNPDVAKNALAKTWDAINTEKNTLVKNAWNGLLRGGGVSGAATPPGNPDSGEIAASATPQTPGEVAALGANLIPGGGIGAAVLRTLTAAGIGMGVNRAGGYSTLPGAVAGLGQGLGELSAAGGNWIQANRAKAKFSAYDDLKIPQAFKADIPAFKGDTPQQLFEWASGPGRQDLRDYFAKGEQLLVKAAGDPQVQIPALSQWESMQAGSAAAPGVTLTSQQQLALSKMPPAMQAQVRAQMGGAAPEAPLSLSDALKRVKDLGEAAYGPGSTYAMRRLYRDAQDQITQAFGEQGKAYQAMRHQYDTGLAALPVLSDPRMYVSNGNSVSFNQQADPKTGRTPLQNAMMENLQEFRGYKNDKLVNQAFRGGPIGGGDANSTTNMWMREHGVGSIPGVSAHIPIPGKPVHVGSAEAAREAGAPRYISPQLTGPGAQLLTGGGSNLIGLSPKNE
jgi:hypothetical protein